ncbi:acyl-CoA dehydrogenase family protein [Catenulispora acidiphila]|nr:acyl-CoA dehydrogenase family protein [Catenulispora acidiphila]
MAADLGWTAASEDAARVASGAGVASAVGIAGGTGVASTTGTAGAANIARAVEVESGSVVARAGKVVGGAGVASAAEIAGGSAIASAAKIGGGAGVASAAGVAGGSGAAVAAGIAEGSGSAKSAGVEGGSDVARAAGAAGGSGVAQSQGAVVAGVALAGTEALPGARGVIAAPRGDGWELTGTAIVDDAQAALFLVALPDPDAPALVAVPRDAPGVSVLTACWPPVVRFAATPVSAADVVAPTAEALADPLARARVRQAAYLLGIAEGAHRVALDHTGFRHQFGSRLRDLPAVSFPLARALVALRATRAAVYRAAWLVDAEPDSISTEPVIALAMAAETAREVLRLCMQSCGVRAMTAELGLHRYFRLAAAESSRYGEPAALWRIVGAARLREARAAAGREFALAAPVGY